MKIKELIEELSKYELDTPILATWEGITKYISIYQAKDGTVLIDADSNFYKDDFLNGKKVPMKRIE